MLYLKYILLLETVFSLFFTMVPRTLVRNVPNRQQRAGK